MDWSDGLSRRHQYSKVSSCDSPGKSGRSSGPDQHSPFRWYRSSEMLPVVSHLGACGYRSVSFCSLHSRFCIFSSRYCSLRPVIERPCWSSAYCFNWSGRSLGSSFHWKRTRKSSWLPSELAIVPCRRPSAVVSSLQVYDLASKFIIIMSWFIGRV